MAKSQLIKDIATNKIRIEEALQRLLLITSELDSDMISGWIISELNGYSQEEKIPDYRKNISYRLIYSGISGRLSMKNQTLPLHYISKEFRSDITQISVKESIRVIETIVAKRDTCGRDLTSLASDVLKNTGIGCYKIFQEYSLLSFEQLLSNVKSKLILFLLDLEKQFGNLDNLDVDKENISNDKKEAVSNSFSDIIYDGKVGFNEL